ncbi:1933_t:CDS:1, partial [Cetraspora pellucida]
MKLLHRYLEETVLDCELRKNAINDLISTKGQRINCSIMGYNADNQNDLLNKDLEINIFEKITIFDSVMIIRAGLKDVKM